MKPWLRNLLFVTAGVALAVLLQFGYRAYEMYTHPLSPITNDGFGMVQIAYHEGRDVCEIKRGESRLLPYGLYKVTIPETGASFLLFKNNRGAPVLHSVDGTLVVETDANSSLMPEKHLQNNKGCCEWVSDSEPIRLRP
jgi:hypothetical protein